MKTYYFITKKAFLKSIVGLLGLTAISCGSYQNKSYYDNDGIYGGEKQKPTTESTEQAPKTVESNNKYKDYFGSNANNYSNEQTEVLTDVENYSSDNNNQNENSNSESYSSWENSNDHITINVYDSYWGNHNYGYWNNYWGYSPWRSGIYLGWNSWNSGWYNPYWGYSGYYGSSWGWNNPYYGGYYGYNNWNNNGYYGNYYAYGNGRRGTVYNDRYGNNGGRNYTPGRRNSTSVSPRNNGGIENPRTGISQPRREPRTGNNSGYNNTPRTRDNQPRTNNNTPRSESPRSNDNVSPRNQSPRTYESPRTESPRGYDSPRSSSSGSSNGSSSGGGRSGGRR